MSTKISYAYCNSTAISTLQARNPPDTIGLVYLFYCFNLLRSTMENLRSEVQLCPDNRILNYFYWLCVVSVRQHDALIIKEVLAGGLRHYILIILLCINVCFDFIEIEFQNNFINKAQILSKSERLMLYLWTCAFLCVCASICVCMCYNRQHGS